MVALTEQSVCTSLPKARPSVHMLPNSPFVAASVAVARPSTKAPARAELMYALMLISYQVGDLRRSRKVRFVRLAGSSVRDPSHGRPRAAPRWNPRQKGS